MAKKKTNKQENHNNEEHDKNTCPECGKESKPIVDMYDGEHFNVWGNNDFISINFYYNDVTLTFPAELFSELKSEFQVLGMLPIPYSEENGSIPPEDLN